MFFHVDGPTSEHVHKQPCILRVQNRGNFFGNPKNTFRFRKIIAIFNSSLSFVSH
jgi:hypothetical protein